MGLFQTPQAIVPASIGGMTLIASISWASVTNFTSIPQTYKDLRVIVRAFRPTTDNRTIAFRYNGDANDSRYFLANYQTDNNSATSFNNSYHPLVNTDNTTVNGIDCIDIFDYTNTSTWKISQILSVANNPTTTTQLQAQKTMGIYNQTPAITSIGFEGLASSIAGGTALLYGVS